MKLRVSIASVIASCKINTEHYFHFSPFFLKAKILLEFILVSEN